MEFSAFFAQATCNNPYAYQRFIAENEWPGVLIAPTGLGKTAAVLLAWLWRRRIAPGATPRRLIYCLPMRTLVEQTAESVSMWLGRLADERLPSRDDVHVLMGGYDHPRQSEPRWYESPERAAILIGTQDMLLSRALMRGYAAPRPRWPIEFALLHNDAQWVFDEVQLMGAGLPTSIQLEAFRSSLGLALPAGSLWISATLDPNWLRTVDYDGPQKVIRVPDDFPDDATSKRVRKLIDAPKRLSKALAAPTSDKKTDIEAYITKLATMIRGLPIPGGRRLIIVNTVERAQKLYLALRKGGIAEEDITLVHSRFRPADRLSQMERLRARKDGIVIATQAIEAGVDLSSAILITELAPWSSLVQRFGRANRYAEWNDQGGAIVYWIDLPAELAAPYEAQELDAARTRLETISDAAPVNLGGPGDLPPLRDVIRRKDFIDLFDTDPDLMGFDVDISRYVRDASDTDVRVFWRDVRAVASEPPRPSRDELCAISIGRARSWIDTLRKQKLQVYVPDPQWRKGDRALDSTPPGWQRLHGPPWPGLMLLVDVGAGGYDSRLGFLGESASDPVPPVPILPVDRPGENEIEGDEWSEGFTWPVALVAHLDDVAREVARIAAALAPRDPLLQKAILRAARWHDIGKAHEVFQDTMRRGLREPAHHDGMLLAKTEKQRLRHGRAYFRHELASALAFLAHEGWANQANFIAYLIAAHHGKVRMSLRALPIEPAPPGPGQPPDGRRFARGIWEGDELPAVNLGDGELWKGGRLMLSVMEIGEDPVTGASWAERTRALLDQYGPFRLAWAEALLTISDWRASAQEQEDSSG